MRSYIFYCIQKLYNKSLVAAQYHLPNYIISQSAKQKLQHHIKINYIISTHKFNSSPISVSHIIKIAHVTVDANTPFTYSFRSKLGQKRNSAIEAKKKGKENHSSNFLSTLNFWLTTKARIFEFWLSIFDRSSGN